MNPFAKLGSIKGPKNSAYAFCKAAELAYEGPEKSSEIAASWGFQSAFVERGETQALILDRGEEIIVSVRGTEINAETPRKSLGLFWRMIQFALRLVLLIRFRIDIARYNLTDILTDLDFRKRTGPFGAKYHKGFLDSANAIWAPDILPYLLRAYKNRPRVKVYFCGHSLGAAVALILALKYAEVIGQASGVYLYGCPRVGDGALSRAVRRLKMLVFLYENNNDVVTLLPFWILGFRKAGQIRYISTEGKVYKNPKASFVLRDRLLGRWQDLFKLGTDGMKDHLLKNYLAGLEG